MAIRQTKMEHGMDPIPFVPPYAAGQTDRKGDVPSLSPVAHLGHALYEELVRVGWDVPGVDVEISMVGSKPGGLRRVLREVSGSTDDGPFVLRFGMHYRDGVPVASSIDSVVIPPGIEMKWYSDDSGPTGYLYVGKDWKADAATFMGSFKTNARLHGEPRLYVPYSGRGRRVDDLVPTGESDAREYVPEGREPRRLSQKKVADAVRSLVDGLVLRLQAMPSAPGHDDVDELGDANLRRAVVQPTVAALADQPTLYAWVRLSDVGSLSDTYAERHPEAVRGFDATGWRLASLSVSDPDGIMPEDAHRGFLACSTDVAAKPTMPGWHHHSDSVPVRIDLKHLNDVFVFDGDAHARQHQATIDAIEATDPERQEFTGKEMNMIGVAAGRSLVPAAEYREGLYANPIYAINRFLPMDEVRLLSGPLAIAEREDDFELTMTDRETGIEVALDESVSKMEMALRHLESYARRVADVVGEPEFLVPDEIKAAAKRREPAPSPSFT